MESQYPVDEKRAKRIAFADTYFNEDLAQQQVWYDVRASSHKMKANYMSLTVIACGALTALIATLKPKGFDPYDAITAALGVLVALVQGSLRIWRFDESWVEYRKASENMKREKRLYVNHAGPYAQIEDEEESSLYFVESIEQIIAEEQQLYFKQDRSPLDRKRSAQENTAASDSA